MAKHSDAFTHEIEVSVLKVLGGVPLLHVVPASEV